MIALQSYDFLCTYTNKKQKKRRKKQIAPRTICFPYIPYLYIYNILLCLLTCGVVCLAVLLYHYLAAADYLLHVAACLL